MSEEDFPEPSWEEKFHRLNLSLASNKRLFTSKHAQRVIKSQVKRIQQLEDDLIEARHQLRQLQSPQETKH
jgi:hypothetical protein